MECYENAALFESKETVHPKLVFIDIPGVV